MFVIRHRIDERENGLSSQVKNIIKKEERMYKIHIWHEGEEKVISPLPTTLYL
jgi:hypothetical protein